MTRLVGVRRRLLNAIPDLERSHDRGYQRCFHRNWIVSSQPERDRMNRKVRSKEPRSPTRLFRFLITISSDVKEEIDLRMMGQVSFGKRYGNVLIIDSDFDVG